MPSNIFKVSLLAAALSLAACGGDDNNNSPAETPEATQQQTISGTITDASGNPLADATLLLADQSVTTDASGNYSFDLTNTTDKIVVFVKKPGYLSLARELVIVPNQSYSLDMALSPDQIATSFDNSAGVSNLLVSGATVTIPANAVSYADGTPFTGTVNIAANYYNPDSIEGAKSFAQPFTGQNADGSDETGLVTVGVIDVKLTDPATGNELNLKSGTSATLTYPAASTDQDLDTIPLWYYDEDKMIWVKDGSATRQDDGSYRGEVNHFTLWNLDIPVGEYNALVEGCVIDSITKAPFTNDFYANITGRGFDNAGSAGTDGKFSIEVPINTPLTLSSASDTASFEAVIIPALAQDVTYQINDGDCIIVNDLTPKKVFNYTEVFEEDFSTLAPQPVVVTPDPEPTPDPFIPPTEQNTSKLIGYTFTFETDPDTVTGLEDISFGTLSSKSSNSINLIEKSLYGANQDYRNLDNTQFLSLTTTGVSPANRLSITANDEIAIESFNTVFTNNIYRQNLSNGFVSTGTYNDVSLSGQKIGTIFSLENNDSFYNDIPDNVINKLNDLPNSLSLFDNNASCKKALTGNVNMDHIDFTDNKLPKLSFEKAVAGFGNPRRTGTWAGIPWIAGVNDLDDDAPIAYVNYNNEVYFGTFQDAARESLKEAEKDDCVFYNESAKDQILAAIQAAYPTL